MGLHLKIRLDFWSAKSGPFRPESDFSRQTAISAQNRDFLEFQDFPLFGSWDPKFGHISRNRPFGQIWRFPAPNPDLDPLQVSQDFGPFRQVSSRRGLATGQNRLWFEQFRNISKLGLKSFVEFFNFAPILRISEICRFYSIS